MEETFKPLKLDLDIRPVYHKSDNGTKEHLHLAILAHWVVSVTKYLLKKKGITLQWSELLRIMSTQQRVTIVAEQTNGRGLRMKSSTAPEEKLAAIKNALGITAKPICSIIIVWPQKTPSPEDSQLRNRHLASTMLQCGLIQSTDFGHIITIWPSPTQSLSRLTPHSIRLESSGQQPTFQFGV